MTSVRFPSTVGAMRTIQTSAGFLLTVVTIQFVGPVADLAGWAGGVSMLGSGRSWGCWAMARLRVHPSARQLVGGRR